VAIAEAQRAERDIGVLEPSAPDRPLTILEPGFGAEAVDRQHRGVVERGQQRGTELGENEGTIILDEAGKVEDSSPAVDGDRRCRRAASAFARCSLLA
jgi:hypothetical protein